MVQRRIVSLLAVITLTVLAAGCAARGAGSGSNLSNPSASPFTGASELSGTWRGSFYQVGGDGHVEGDMTIEIKDDATFTVTTTRLGRGTVNGSGVVVANGRNVALKARRVGQYH